MASIHIIGIFQWNFSFPSKTKVKKILPLGTFRWLFSILDKGVHGILQPKLDYGFLGLTKVFFCLNSEKVKVKRMFTILPIYAIYVLQMITFSDTAFFAYSHFQPK